MRLCVSVFANKHSICFAFACQIFITSVSQSKRRKKKLANIYTALNISSKNLGKRCSIFWGHYFLKGSGLCSIQFKRNEWKSLNLLISLNSPNSICIPIAQASLEVFFCASLFLLACSFW